jgi:hypothetical protein
LGTAKSTVFLFLAVYLDVAVFSVDRQRDFEVDLCISVVHGINFLSEGHKYCNGLQLVIAIMYYLCLLLNIKHITFWEFNLKRQG